jgi:hypothetical protein
MVSLKQNKKQTTAEEAQARQKQLIQQCRDSGGTWDQATKKCVFGPKEEKPEVEQQTQPPIEDSAARGFLDPLEAQEARERSERIRRAKVLGLRGKELEEFVQGEEVRREQVREQAAEIRQQQAVAEAQEQLQTTQRPERRELDPTLEPGEEFPVFGPLRIKARKAAATFLKQTPLRKFVERLDPREQTEFFELEPETLKTQALTQIERNEIQKGLTRSEQFGSFVESLGLGGLTNFAAEKPSENVQTILRQLRTAKTRATDAETKVRQGIYTQTYGEEVITNIENDIQRFESRMKLLIQNSPELKFNSDGVNFIEEKIFEARERLFSARINMLEGQTKDPTEIQVLQALQESIQEESFEIPT